MKMDWLGYRSDFSKCCTNKHLSDARCLFSLSLSLSLGFPRLTLDFPVDVSVDFGLVMLTSPTYLGSPFHSLVCLISYFFLGVFPACSCLDNRKKNESPNIKNHNKLLSQTSRNLH